MSQFNLAVFFDGVRHSLFRGSLTTKQVEGMEFILEQWGETGFTDRRWLAYALATTLHETASTMQPIREYGKGKGKKYGKPDPQTGQTYYGRGYVQLTWKTNYQKASKVLGIDFVRNPDLVMDPANAAFIMFQGMKDAWFTGKGFSDYINEDGCDYWNARRIINGTDRAAKIQNYAHRFETAIEAAWEAKDDVPAPTPPTPAPEPAPTPPEQPQSLLARIIEAIIRMIFK